MRPFGGKQISNAITMRVSYQNRSPFDSCFCGTNRPRKLQTAFGPRTNPPWTLQPHFGCRTNRPWKLQTRFGPRTNPPWTLQPRFDCRTNPPWTLQPHFGPRTNPPWTLQTCFCRGASPQNEPFASETPPDCGSALQTVAPFFGGGFGWLSFWAVLPLKKL